MREIIVISIIIVSAILFVATKAIHKDKDLVEFSSMLALVIVPAIISFLVSMAIGAFELAPIFQFSGLVAAVLVVFFFSNSMFEWGYKRAGALAAVYLVANVVIQVVFMSFINQ